MLGFSVRWTGSSVDVMDVQQLVTAHYGRLGIARDVLEALASTGVDVDALTAPDLAPFDHLHLGGRGTTARVLARLTLTPGMHLLDVGSGLGGPARMAAYDARCRVTGIDLTADFVEAATTLTARVGLAESVEFRACDATAMPFEDASFDAAMMIHVGMNLPDKAGVFAEVRRVLRPGGRFAVFDQMRTRDDQPEFPCPWAGDEDGSFLATEEDYRALLTDAGLRVTASEDLTDLGLQLFAQAQAASEEGPTSPGRLSLFGPGWPERIRHDMDALRSCVLLGVLLVAEAA